MNGQQVGDPAKLGAALVTIAALATPPLRIDGDCRRCRRTPSVNSSAGSAPTDEPGHHNWPNPSGDPTTPSGSS